MNRFARSLLLFAILFAGWLLMSGYYTPLLISLGVASCAFAVVLAHLIGASDDEGLPLHIFAGLPAYLVWLLREIVMSNIATGKIILFGVARPTMFTVPATQSTAAGIATYANSITLTPGTVTIEMDANSDGTHDFLVHALDQSFADDVENGEMDRRVTALEGEGST